MKRLLIMMALLVAQSPAYAISSSWEYDNPKKAIAVWAITLPWRVSIRIVKIITREAISVTQFRRYTPSESDYRAAQLLGDR